MTKNKQLITVLIMAFIFMAIPDEGNSQFKFPKISINTSSNSNKPAATTKPNTANTTSNQGNNDVANEPANANGRPKYSGIKDDDFVQNESISKIDKSDTRFEIAKNLLVDIKGTYRNGYSPKWRFIHYSSDLDYDVADWVHPKSQVGHEKMNVAIGDYKGKLVLSFPAYMSCRCYADIVIDSIAVLTEKPQTFKITNFQKVLNGVTTGEKCYPTYNYWYTNGGWEGKITLSANQNGDIKMSMLVESYTTEHIVKQDYKTTVTYPPQVYQAYTASNITIDNEMSAEKANGIIAAEMAAKQRQKDYEAKTKKQLDSLMKMIAKKYPQAECRECFYSSSGGYISSTNVDEYYVNSGSYAGSHTEFGMNVTTTIQNKCKHDLTFVGIQQMHDDERGYYLQEVTKTMPANYNYRSDQGVMASVFSSILGMGSEFSFKVQDKYYIGYASVGAVQWLKVVKN